MRSRRKTFAQSSPSFAIRTAPPLSAVFTVFLSLIVLLGEGCRTRHQDDRSGRCVAAARDALGTNVTLREYPRRIVSLAPSNTEILLALGLRENLVGVTSFYGQPEKVKGIPTVGGYINPSVEKVISLRPDLVFAARGNSRDAIEYLRRHGVKAFTLDTRSLGGLFRDVKVIGLLTGKSERASHLVAELEKEVHAVRQKVAGLSDREKPTVFWMGQEQPLRTAGPGTLVDELVRLAGGRNVAGDEKRAWPSYGTEKLLLQNPEVIILAEDTYKNSPDKLAQTLARFRRDSIWRNISAVREGRVHFIPTDLLGQPSPAFVEGLKLLAEYLHPDLFPEQPNKIAERHGEVK